MTNIINLKIQVSFPFSVQNPRDDTAIRTEENLRDHGIELPDVQTGSIAL